MPHSFLEFTHPILSMLVVLSSAVGDVERGGVGRVGGMTSEVPMGRHALITKGKRNTNKFIDGTGFHQPGSQPPPPQLTFTHSTQQ